MPYRYRPLNAGTGEIRLLCIPIEQEGVNNHAKPLHCSIDYVQSSSGYPFKDGEVLDSDHSPWGEYDALSYEWGIAEPKQTIVLDGEPFNVNPNLFGALQRVRNAAQGKSQAVVRLWVDAICIDQSNLEERKALVPHMRHIYGCARTVYCHLTPYSLSRALESEERAGQDRDFDADMRFATLLVPILANLPKSDEASVFESLEGNSNAEQAEQWLILLRLLANSYWKRLWVVQEIVLASKQVVILAGSTQFDFEDVSRADAVISNGLNTILNFIKRNLEANELLNLQGFGAHFRNIKILRAFRKEPPKDQVKDDLEVDLAALEFARSSLCTDPRDRVFGMLGLMSRKQASKVIVDYSKPVEEVYTNFMATVVEETGSLYALALFPYAYTEEQASPSWVPDLRNNSTSMGLNKFNASSMLTKFGRPKIALHSHLKVPGLFLDHIDGLAATLPTYATLHARSASEIVQADAPDRFKHKYDDFDGLKLAFWNTLLCADDQTGGKPLPLAKEHLTAMSETSLSARNFKDFFDVNNDFLIADCSLDSFFADTPEDSHQHLDILATWSRAFGNMNAWHLRRRMTYTVNGRLGLAPVDARKGDAIWALCGMNALAVLRKGGDSWKFIGACYVYGLMDGKSTDVIDHLDEVEEVEIS